MHGDFFAMDSPAPAHVVLVDIDHSPSRVLLALLREVFTSAEGHVLPFANPLTGGESANGVYVARL